MLDFSDLKIRKLHLFCFQLSKPHLPLPSTFFFYYRWQLAVLVPVDVWFALFSDLRQWNNGFQTESLRGRKIWWTTELPFWRG